MNTAPRIVLATFGSHGDLHPFMAVALELKHLGAIPVIAAAPFYQTRVESEGIEFRPMRPDHHAVEQDLGLSREAIVRKVSRRPDFLLRRMILPYLRESFEDAMAATADAQMVVTHMAAYGARFAAEKRGLAHLGVALMPMIFLSRFDPPATGTLSSLAHWFYRRGPAAAGAFLSIGKAVSMLWAGPIERLRRDVGLPPSSVNPFFEGQFSSTGALALYSRVLGEPQPDYPQPTRITGFPFYDRESADQPGLAPELDAFLRSGDKPLVFTLGTSAVHDSDAFVSSSVTVAEALNRRAVLVLDTERVQRWRGRLPPQLHVCSCAPYSQLFPHAEVVVHHGGIGTTAQAMRAGRPQFIAPYLVDQPDNAARMVRLGVGLSLPATRYSPQRVAPMLRQLMAASTFASRARWVAAEVAREDGAREAARAILQVLDERTGATARDSAQVAADALHCPGCSGTDL